MRNNIQKTLTPLIRLLFGLFTLIGTSAFAQTTTLRGLRVDPSYFYNLYPGLTANAVANQVVSKAKASGTNTLFVYAYNSVYGAFYPTTYVGTKVENGYGAVNIFKELTTVAKLNSMKVVAVVPVNNFKTIWDSNPSWRIKQKNGADYIPFTGTYLLSAWHPDFRIWLKGLYQDLLFRNPDVDGIEAVEPTVDYFWRKDSDYNAIATQKYLALYPNGLLGDQNWLNFRAQGMTDLMNIMNTAAHAANKKSYLVQTWPVKPDGTLFSSQVIKDNMGLDFDAILSLTAASKLDYVMAEFIWQQWASDYGTAIFNPAWTRQASQAFINYVGTKSIPLLHVEISSFTGSFATITPTLSEFASSLQSISDLNVGIDVYDFNQLAKTNAWTQLTSWGSSVTPPAPPPVVACSSTTRTITSVANSAGLKQNCLATLATSNTSSTAVVASVTNAGSYSLVCLSTGQWASTPSVSSCPAPAVVAPPPVVRCPATTRTITSVANSAGVTQNCVATLPISNPSSTPVVASVTNSGKYSLLCKSTGVWASSASSSSCPAPAVVAPPPPPPTTTTAVYGITIDSISGLSDIVTALKNLSHKPTTRIVFDENVAASYYQTAAAQIHAVSFVMGEILDSFYMKSITTANYAARTTQYLNTLGNNVDIWEIGNEINGEWLGDTPTVVAKMNASYNLVKAAGKKTALTLYYNEECWAKPSNEVFTWAQANVPSTMKQNLDYVWISYYEDDCNNLQPNWPAVFQRLATMFPNSKIGFGEVGTNKAASKATYINRYYNMVINQPNYVGGYFWWYGSQDLIPMSKPLWSVFNEAIR
jgi:hypothetical protein